MRNNKAINQEQFRQRDKAVKKQKHVIQQMKTKLHEERNVFERAKQQHLLHFAEINSSELRAVEQYLDGRFFTARDIYRNISRLVPWVDDASIGKARLKSVFRLARIKGYMNKIKAEEHKVNLDLKLQKKLLSHMIEVVTGEEPNRRISILKQASEAFHGNNIQEKIQKLERATSIKKQEVHHMKAWFMGSSNIRRKNPEPPPELSSLKQMSRGLKPLVLIRSIAPRKDSLLLPSIFNHTYKSLRGGTI